MRMGPKTKSNSTDEMNSLMKFNNRMDELTSFVKATSIETEP
jgi:hypothetical protein